MNEETILVIETSFQGFSVKQSEILLLCHSRELFANRKSGIGVC